MPDGDGIEEAVVGQLRVALTAAAQLAEVSLRAREDALRRAAIVSEREAQELRSRLAAQQQAARSELANVHRPDWWERAKPQDIAHAYGTAQAWAGQDPEAARAEERMREELRTRYDTDPRTYVDAVQADAEAARQVRQQAEDAKVFSAWDFRGESDITVKIDKAEALRRLETMPTDIEPVDGRTGGGPHDVPGWVGRDYDVDLVIAAKFPQVLSEADRARIAAETERRREAAERAEEQRLTREADREDGRAAQQRAEGQAVEVGDGQRPGSAPLDADPEAVAARVRDLIRGQMKAGAGADQDASESAQATSTGTNPWLAGAEPGTGSPSATEDRASQARTDAAAAYDSAGRRAEQAAALIAGRMAADVSQGRPATDAVKDTGRKAPRARRVRSGGAQQKQRGELSR